MSWVGAGVAAISIGSSLLGGSSANKAAKDAAKQQAALTYRQRSEEIRRKALSDRQQLGLATAAVYASNLQMKGSSEKYVNAIDMENMRQQAFAQEARKREQEAILAGARGAGNSLFYQAAGDALGYAAKQMGSYFASQAPSGLNAQGVASTTSANFRSPASIG
jgi:hypothetical protein